MMKLHSKSQGFTLIELMTTIMIAAILLTIAVPSFRSYQAGQQVRSAAEDLASALNFARSEAVKRSATVEVAPVAADWSEGWTVVWLATPTPALKTYGAPSGVTITSSSASSPTYNGSGRLTTAELRFTVADSGGSVSRCVKVALSGKATDVTGACAP